jgi:membrane protein DedA with SNARE-associated domain
MLPRVNEVLDAVLGAIQGVDPALRTLLAGLAMLFETSILVGLVVPGDSIVIVASTGVDGGLQWLALFLAVVVGSLAGESIGFALGNAFGPRIRASRLGRRIGESHWVRAENYLERRGGIAVAISRFLPVLHSLIPITVGMSGMSYRRFLAWTAPACALWAALYVSVGAAAAGSYRELSSQLHGAGYIFAAILVVFAIAVIVVKRIVGNREHRHMHKRGAGAVEAEETDSLR